jgi:hypothetical protein
LVFSLLLLISFFVFLCFYFTFFQHIKFANKYFH